MSCWPVSESFNKNISNTKSPGCFWENRKDRFHCGVDIYAPKHSEIKSIKDGKVSDTGVFTSSKKISYWNTTFFVDVKIDKNLFFRYAELDRLNVKKGEIVDEGNIIGYVGQVLNKYKIDDSSPVYIQRLKNQENLSMLHFEMYNSLTVWHEKYLGGNWFGNEKPDFLLDPTDFLRSIYNKK